MSIQNKTLIDINNLAHYDEKNKEYIGQKITEMVNAKTNAFVIEKPSKITLVSGAAIPDSVAVTEYDNVSTFTTINNDNKGYNDVKIGDVIFIKLESVPDFWVSAINEGNMTFTITSLETQKSILGDFYSKAESDTKFATKQALGTTDENLNTLSVQVGVNKDNILSLETDMTGVKGRVTNLETATIATESDIDDLFPNSNA